MIDGRLDDLYIDAPDDGRPQPGAIYRAKMLRPIKGLHGATVDLGDGQTGFLREARGLAPGDSFLVQINSHSEDGKAPPVTRRLLFKSRHVIVTPDAPGINIARRIRDDDRRDTLLELVHDVLGDAGLPDGAGVILRSVCDAAPEDQIAEDLADTAALAANVLADAEGDAPELLVAAPEAELRAWQDWVDPAPDSVERDDAPFERLGIWDALAALQSPRADLPGQGWMAVEPTSALVAVDVNSGGDFSPAATLKANLAAAAELPRQLRLRGLGGQVVVDFAPLGKKDRKQVEQALRRALKSDPVETSLIGWTPMGHLELQRKRERQPLSELWPR
ncbi:ribonuclease G [Rhodobacteraceae bacterium KN286]|uniref:Ribonuclease G n=2 Tax=Oceanomicrobium pacificus TaxID=2692916 RepID=A0A6B0TZW5_9RHOB|nr:ribonuclease G [Oceanomicrobium pacificus]